MGGLVSIVSYIRPSLMIIVLAFQHVYLLIQPGEGPSRGLLRDCENRWIVCSSSFYPQQSPVERNNLSPLLPGDSFLNRGIFQMELHLFTSMFLWGVFQPLTTLKWWVPDCSFLSLTSLIIHQDVVLFCHKNTNVDFFHFHAVLSTAFNPYSQSSQTCWKLDRKFHF